MRVTCFKRQQPVVELAHSRSGSNQQKKKINKISRKTSTVIREYDPRNSTAYQSSTCRRDQNNKTVATATAAGLPGRCVLQTHIFFHLPVRPYNLSHGTYQVSLRCLDYFQIVVVEGARAYVKRCSRRGEQQITQLLEHFVVSGHVQSFPGFRDELPRQEAPLQSSRTTEAWTVSVSRAQHANRVLD